MRILPLTLAACLLPGTAAAQGGFLPGGREILSVSFTGTQGLPPGVSLASGNAQVVTKDGTRMLRAASPTELLLQLPEVLPKDFTLELELVPKACCNPHDLSVEGTARINQGPASAHILWDSDGTLSVIGGGETYTTEMPEDLKASLPGSVTMVGISLQDETLKLYTNGRRLFTLQERRFSRGRVLRVFLGGQDAAEQAVYLSRIRVATGPPAGTPLAQEQPTAPGSPDSAGQPIGQVTQEPVTQTRSGVTGDTTQAAPTTVIATVNPGIVVPGAPAPMVVTMARPEVTMAMVAPSQFGWGAMVVWSAVPGAEAYRVHRMATSTSPGELIATVSEADAAKVVQSMNTSTLRGALDPWPGVKYWVEAVVGGAVGEPGPIADTKYDTSNPFASLIGQVSGLRVTVGGTTTVALRDGQLTRGSRTTWEWDRVAGAHLYHIGVFVRIASTGSLFPALYYREVVRIPDPAPFHIMIQGTVPGPPYPVAFPAGSTAVVCVSLQPNEWGPYDKNPQTCLDTQIPP